ncbi:MAG: hypothetical protein LIO46_04935, partial [Clostridiales bacterium]|nr:hypothetical protein [Clostridiales bacterium]
SNSVSTVLAVFYVSGEADGFLCEHNLEYNTRVGTFTLLVGMELKNAADLISTNRVSLSLIVNGTTYALEQEFVFDLYDEKANATTTTTKAGSTTTTTKQSVTSTTKSGAGSGVTTSSGGSSGSASGSSGGGSSASGSGSGGSASGGSYSSGSGLSSGGVSDGEVVADAAGAEGAEPYDAEVILPNTGSSALGWKSIVALVCAIVVSLAGLGAVGYGLYQRKQEAALEDGEDMEQDTADTLD